MNYLILPYGLAGLLSLAVQPAQADTLQEIYLLALGNDHQLKADTAAYSAGKEALTLGRAGILPQINATGQYEDETADISNTGTPSSPLSKGKGETNSDTTFYRVSLTQPLFDLPAWFGYQQGKALSKQAAATFGADQQALIIRVSEAYFDVLRAVDNLETSIAEQKALGHQLEQTKQRFEVGLTAITDVHEAQAAYDNATAVTLEARGNMGIAFEAMEVITGRSHNEIAPLVDKFPVVNPVPVQRQQWVEFALQNNYQLKASQLAAEAARQEARAKTSAHLPIVTGSLSYDDSQRDGRDLSNAPFENGQESKKITINVNLPLFAGGRISAERRQAHSQHMQSRELYRKAERDTIQAARSLHLSVVTDVAQVKARRQAITSSLSALEATQAGYDVGTRNLVDVLVAQRTVYQARRNYSNALFDYVINTLKLKEVAGNLTPQDIKELNDWLDANKPVVRSKYEK